MAINIQSLFSDIIETPAQRQERMLTEGILRGRELTGGLTGLARTQAPLVSALSMQMPQRQEALRRGVGGMLGLDVRTESEKLQDILKGVDPSKPETIIAAAQRVGELGMGAQAAQMRAMAAETSAAQDAATAERLRKEQQAIRDANIIRYSQGLVSNNPELAALMPNLDPQDALKLAQESIKEPDRNIFLQEITGEDNVTRLVMFDREDPDFQKEITTLAPKEDELEIKPLSARDEDLYKGLFNQDEVIKDLRGVGLGFRQVDDNILYDRITRIRAENPDKTPGEHVKILSEQMSEEIEQSRQAEQQQAQEIAGQITSSNLEELSNQAAAARIQADMGQSLMGRAQSRSDAYLSSVIPSGRR